MPVLISAGLQAADLWLWIALVILAVLTILAVIAGLAFFYYRTELANFFRACADDGSGLRTLQAEREVLRLVAAGGPLQGTMDSILLAVEKYLPGRMMSILLYDKEAGCLRDGSAPSLPESYRKYIDGRMIGPEAGSCGSAAWHGAPVIAEDISTDYRWTPYRESALSHHLHACWSIPVFDCKRELLAILGTYSRQTGRPDAAELECLESVARAVGVLIERERASAAEAALRERLEEAKREAEAGKHLRAEVLATVSHELRSPLHGILGAVALVGETELTSDQRSYAHVIRDCGEHLLRLVNDLLDLSRIEAGRVLVECVPFHFRETVESTARAMAVQAAQKQLTFTVSIDPTIVDLVTGDPGRLRQVLTNLLANAIKFTSTGSVSLQANRLDAGQDSRFDVEFVVRDTGVGIRKEAQALLFQPFYQEQATRHHGGTGLGLTISKHLVELMGGTIGFESEEGVGSTFWVRLPLQAPPSEPQAVPRAQHEPTRSLRVLAVEDNPINLHILERLLARLGHQVTAAHTAEQALTAFAQQKFDLILMDCRLPDADGCEAAAAIRAREGDGEHVPILALSAAAAAEDRARCLAAGMVGFLSKPVSLAELEEALAACAGSVPRSAG